MRRMHVIWKDIPGYEGRYQASTDGQIRSVDRRVRLVVHGTETTRLVHGRVLKPGAYTKSGHVSVVLGRGANGSPVHQLIALTFLGPKPAGCEVCHNDGNPTNNAVSNLRYDTRSENNRDITRQGKRKLSLDDVQQIRKMLRERVPGNQIARAFKVSDSLISAIKTGKEYAHG